MILHTSEYPHLCNPVRESLYTAICTCTYILNTIHSVQHTPLFHAESYTSGWMTTAFHRVRTCILHNDSK